MLSEKRSLWKNDCRNTLFSENRKRVKKLLLHMTEKNLRDMREKPIAVALKACGVMVHRYTKKEHQPRGIFCAIGRCTDCVMIVDGKPNIRTCVTPLKAGMKIQTQYGVSDKPFNS